MNTINLTQQIEPPHICNPSDSFLDLASACHDLDVGPFSNDIFPNGAHKEKILSHMRNTYLLSHEFFSSKPKDMEWGEHRFNQQTFLLLVAHIEGEF